MRFFDKIRRAARYKRLLMIRAYKLKRTLPSYPRCKNCETELQGMYCHKCGQYALETKQSFWKFISEYFSNTYQTDGRAINTLKLLVTYPGFLSSEFVKGRVASYVHPMKLYLFSSIVFFAFMFLMTPSSDEIVKQSSTKTEQVADSLKNNSVALTTPAVKTADEDKPVKLYQQKFLVEAVFGILKQYMPLFMCCVCLYTGCF